MRRNCFGKIKIASTSLSTKVVTIVLVVLLSVAVLALFSFDYKNIDFANAMNESLKNIESVFFMPILKRDTLLNVLYALLETLCLGALSTLFGMILALVFALLSARNISNKYVSAAIKSFIAVIRAIPTVMWVLIFAVCAGLGSIAAVIGLTFHSFAYLTKVYAESIEEIDEGTIEALRATGANYFQIVTNAVLPSCISLIVAWTFMRFEINFTNAVAMGSAAGAGGIGYNIFMAGSFYFDLHEMGFLTYVVVLMVIILEFVATKIKAYVK